MPEHVKLSQMIEQINSLPSLPSVATKIMQLVANPDSRPMEIAEIISLDPALTAKVLRLVNSAFYGLRKQVSTVSQAVIYLGFNIIKNLALTASVFDAIKLGEVHKDLFEALMIHSVAVGMAAENIGQRLKFANPGELFTFGVLHDLGKMVEMQYFPDLFAQVHDQARDKQLMFIESEQEILGFTHVQVVYKLLVRWALPENLYETIGGHHDFTGSSLVHRRDVAVLSLADYIVNKVGLGHGFNYSEEIPLHQDIFSTLMVDSAFVEAVTEELHSREAELNELARHMDR